MNYEACKAIYQAEAKERRRMAKIMAEAKTKEELVRRLLEDAHEHH